jgi:hypothetical protein
MIKTLIAHTAEMDDPGSAVSEILKQLKMEKNLLRNSVGIMACYIDFMKNGIVRAICEHMPFDVVGINTLGSAVSESGGQLLLSLAVLTSDDVFFSAGISDPLDRGYEKSLADLYNNAAVKLPDRPALMLTFAPLFHEVSQDHLVRCFSELSGNVPVFGVVAADYGVFFENPLVLFNGETYDTSLGMVLLSGSITPRFTFSGISEKRVMQRKAVATLAEDNLLKEINEVPALQYLESLGFVKNGKFEGGSTIPLVVDYNDGTPPSLRTIVSITPEGYLLLAGGIAKNCAFGVGVIDFDYIVETAEELASEVRDCDFLLIGSCIARNFVLEWNNLAEIDCIRSRLAATPFLFIYSSGEFCPVKTENGRLVNRFHNLTLVSCAF